MGLIIRQNRFGVFKKRLQKVTAAGIRRATIFLHAQARIAVSVPNTGVTKTRKRKTKTKGGKTFEKGSSYTVYENPSAPGQPPRTRKRTGFRNVVHEYNDNDRDPRGRVGVKQGGIHLAYLEVGTARVKARPWLLATLRKFGRIIGKMMATGGGGVGT